MDSATFDDRTKPGAAWPYRIRCVPERGLRTSLSHCGFTGRRLRSTDNSTAGTLGGGGAGALAFGHVVVPGGSRNV